ncbi:MAG TPA: sigma-54 factor interaction domain-containing protein, partial [Candidatus Latescibacteria bacterium]|nr:sigma-54 factor interaction domain-containing protein [Candidatus Latescibacterota bacterium]
MAQALEHADLYARVVQENVTLRRELQARHRFANIIGGSRAMQEVFRLLERVIPSSAMVLIEGETGTGKELIARAIHYNGPRKEKRFVSLDCGAFPEELLESELFGHKKGAFTGAIRDKAGLFEYAEGGTVLLDEICNANPSVQARLLRVLQEGEIRRLGENEPRRVDVRVLCATNRDIEQEVEEGRFRKDLYYRLRGVRIVVPPLR